MSLNIKKKYDPDVITGKM